jgi:hypothetical protein
MADTQREPDEVYAWYEWLKEEVARSPVPIPMYQVTAGDLGASALKVRVSKKTGNTYIKTLIPAYVAKPDGSKALMGRRCTTDFKIRALTKLQRKLAEVPRARKGVPVEVRVEVAIGISIDEYIRMKPSREPWARHVHPLVDERISRRDCEAWLWKNYRKIAPKSACYFCPFHSDEHWKMMQNHQPEAFAAAVKFDNELREAARLQTGSARLAGDVFLHSSMIPLGEVIFGGVPDHLQVDMFGNECEGMCGV